MLKTNWDYKINIQRIHNQYSENKISFDEYINEIVREIDQYRDNIRKPDTVIRLKAALTEDQELRELICSRAGERGYSHLLSTVESFMK